MSDHEIDRRLNDGAFKLKVTEQIAEIKTDLKNNTEKTQGIKEDLRTFRDQFERTMNGDHGHTARLIGVEQGQKSMKSDLTFRLIVGGLIVVILGNRLSPIICDYLYQKTHMKIFQSPLMEIPPPPRKHITHVRYRYVIENPKEPDPIDPATP